LLKTPTKVVSIVPPKPEGARTELRVLDAYVDRIRCWSSAPAQSDSIPFENAEVEVGPWAARAIHRFCSAPNPTKGEAEELVTQGVAVMAKCRTDLRQGGIDTADLTQTFARQAEMMLGVAVGTVVVRALQQKSNALLTEGNNEDAGELNQFQHDVRHAVQDVRNALNENEKRRANEIASAFLKEGVQPSVESDRGAPVAAPAAPPSRSAATSRPRRRAEVPASRRPHVFHVDPPRPTRVRGFLIPIAGFLALVAVGIYGLARNAGTPIQGDASESLIAAMADVRGITEVQDRMPYIVLTVHADFWASSGESERHDWIGELSRTVERHGYTGLLVRTTSGVPLAEWVRDRGVKFANRE
jgi:intracellular sulfur oxidation DsrE/DsrF family protein